MSAAFVGPRRAVMLLLPYAEDAASGIILALSSTLAGNLLIVGSIANIIVIDQARRHGVWIDTRCSIFADLVYPPGSGENKDG